MTLEPPAEPTGPFIEFAKVKDVIADLQDRGVLRRSVSDIESAKRMAKQILKTLPPNGELNWHGADGRPCPCSSCCLDSTRFLSERSLITTEPAVLKKRKRR